jgi:D-alanyl-D-alanine carboxypeptidase/D-alanyl-D-alanine-endopeptidase (penicillin-binding protein 4)
VSLLEPNDQVAGIFRQLWTEMGGNWSGAARDGQTPAGARLLHSHDSPLLAEIVRDTNKFSNNVMARQLFLTLGTDAADAPASAGRSINAIKSWLVRKGIAAPELVLENGIGLSRTERISAANLASLLQAAWASPVMPEFIASLPIVGLDGTMRRRLKSDGVTGRAHIKTGLLSDARAMAGYVLDRSGRRQVVVMLVNHPNAAESQPAMDALLRQVYESAR